jgi:two-component system, cell cycle sensor histidine kinase and response regulator CckA
MKQPENSAPTPRVAVPSPRWLPTRVHATRIALWYGLFGMLWILFSSWILHHIVREAAVEAWLETIKGWLFVGTTALLLGLALNRYFHVIRQSVKQVQESELRLQLLGDNLPDCYVFQYTHSEGGRPCFTYVSGGVERVHGLRVEDILRDAECLLSQMSATQRLQFADAERDSALAMSDFSLEFNVGCADGHVRTLQIRSRPRKNSRGDVEWDGFVADVTKIRQAEAEARAGEDRLRLFIENARMALAMFDRDMCYLAVSPRWRSDFHLGDQELIGRCHYEVFPEIPDELRAIHRRCMAGEVLRGEAEPFVRADGTVQWLHWEIQPWRTTADTIGGVIVSSEEVTEQKRNEEERSRLAAAMEQAVESICITDVDARILYVNPAFEKTTGFTRQEALGQTPRLLKSGRQDANFYEQLWSVLKRGEVWRGHFINKRKDGSLFEENAAISPIRDHSGVITNYVAIKLDVTREMALETELRQIQKLEAIGQLAGGVAHDFNNILAVILMQSEQALEEELSPSMQGCITDIKQAAERACSLTRQLLLFSRRQIMQSRILDLNEVVTNLAKMLRRILGEDVLLRLDLHSRPLWIDADAGMLDQVLMNLSVNARDAMPSGGRLTVTTGERTINGESVRENPTLSPGRYACLSVHDDGAGIAPDVLPHIFEPFFTTKAPGKGTGLGLATVFGIVKQHKGWVDVQSAVGQGTTFQILLPGDDTQRADGEEVTVKTKARGGGETILVVEDDSRVSKVVRTILERYGYRVFEARHGKQALAVAQQVGERLDLLLTDMVLPEGMDGREIASQLRSLLPGLKVVFMSGYSPELAGRPLALHSEDCFIQKPFESAAVLAMIRRCLES